MRRLDRYVASTILVTTFAVLVVLVGLDALGALINEFESISETYTLANAVIYAALSLPRRIHVFIPFASLIGTLIALGRLASSSELVVIRTAGISLLQFAVIVFKPAVFMAALGFMTGEYLSPLSEQTAVSYRTSLQNKSSNFIGFGAWIRDDNTYVHVALVQGGGLIFDVTLLTFDDDHRLTRSLRAERGTFLQNHWLLENVSRTHLSREHAAVDHLVTWRWDTSITPELLVLEVFELDNLSVRQLWSYVHYLEEQGLSFKEVEVAFWHKVFQPLTIIALVLLAISFIFGPLRESNMGAKVLTGVIVAVIFRISQDFFNLFGLALHIPAVLSVLLPIGIWAVIGVWMLTRKD